MLGDEASAIEVTPYARIDGAWFPRPARLRMLATGDDADETVPFRRIAVSGRSNQVARLSVKTTKEYVELGL